MAWVSGKWDNFADVLHTGGKHQQTLKSKAESTVGDGTILTQVTVPPVVGFNQTLIGNNLVKDIQTLFTLGSANNFTNKGSQQIHACAGLLVVVKTHVECLNGDGVVGDECWLFKDLLGDVTLMLTLQILTPCNGKFKFNLFISNLLGEDLNSFGVCHTGKWFGDSSLETINQTSQKKMELKKMLNLFAKS